MCICIIVIARFYLHVVPATTPLFIIMTEMGDGVPYVGGHVGDNTRVPLVILIPPHFQGVAWPDLDCDVCSRDGGGEPGGTVGVVGHGIVGVGGCCSGVGVGGGGGSEVGDGARGGVWGGGESGCGWCCSGVVVWGGGLMHQHDVVVQVNVPPHFLTLDLRVTNSLTHSVVPVVCVHSVICTLQSE